MIISSRPSQLLPLGPHPRQPGLGPLAQPHPILLGNGGQEADDVILEHAGAVEELLGEGLELHPGGGQLLQVVQRFGHALPAEAVERPEQHRVEAALVGIEQQLLELGAVGGAAAVLVAVLLKMEWPSRSAKARSSSNWLSLVWPLSRVETRA